jgi:hypothetical protein
VYGGPGWVDGCCVRRRIGLREVHDQDLGFNWIAEMPPIGLGDEAVAGKSDAGAGYSWRRGNLVLSASIFRGSDHAFDFVAAARAYARQIDERAKAP